MKRILISEEEKNRILGMHVEATKRHYGLVNEQGTPTPTTQTPTENPPRQFYTDSQGTKYEWTAIKNAQDLENFLNFITEDLLIKNLRGWFEQKLGYNLIDNKGKGGNNLLVDAFKEGFKNFAKFNDKRSKIVPRQFSDFLNAIKKSDGIQYFLPAAQHLLSLYQSNNFDKLGNDRHKMAQFSRDVKSAHSKYEI